MTHLTVAQHDSDRIPFGSAWASDRPERVCQTVLALTDHSALERVAQPAEASPHLLRRMEALIQVIDHLRTLSMSEPGEGTPIALTAENIGVYVSEEACEVLNAIQQQAIHAPGGARHLLQQPNLVTDLLPPLLWAIARSDYAYMQWLGGIAARIQVPGQPWQSGMLRLVAVLTATEAEPAWQLDLAIGDAPGPCLADDVQVAQIAGVDDEHPLTVRQLLSQIHKQLQVDSSDLALLIAGSPAEWLTPGEDWRSGQLQLSLQFTFMADANTDALIQAVDHLKSIAPELGEVDFDKPSPDEMIAVKPEGERVDIAELEELAEAVESSLSVPTQDAVTLEMFQDDLSQVEEGVAAVLPGTVPGTRVALEGAIERTRLTQPAEMASRSNPPVEAAEARSQADLAWIDTQDFASEPPIAPTLKVENFQPDPTAAENLTLDDFGGRMLSIAASDSKGASDPEESADSELNDQPPMAGETLDTAFDTEEATRLAPQARTIAPAPPTITTLTVDVATEPSPIPATLVSQVPELWLDLGKLQPTPAVSDQLRRQQLTLVLSQFQREYQETGWPDLSLEEDDRALQSLVTTAWNLSRQDPPSLTAHFPNSRSECLTLKMVLPWLLWQVAKTSCPIMQLVGGITTDLLQPGANWQNGLLRLVPVMHLQAEELDLSLDVATGEPWHEETANLSGSAVVQAETFHPLQGPTRIDDYRFTLIQQMQWASPIVNLLTGGAEIAVSTTVDHWQTGTLSLGLHFTLENWL